MKKGYTKKEQPHRNAAVPARLFISGADATEDELFGITVFAGAAFIGLLIRQIRI
jgi:hypothetical protein